MTADTLPFWLNYQASEQPVKVALRHKQRGIWQEKRWLELRHDIASLVSALQAKGFARGDTLYLLSDPRPEALLLAIAAHWLGGSATPLDPNAGEADTLSLLARLQPAFIFAEGQCQVDLALKSALKPPLIIYADARGLSGYRQGGLQPYAQWLGAANAGSISPPIAQAHDDAFVFFRLDPHGQVERLNLTHHQLLNQGRELVKQERLTSQEEALAARAFAASGHLRYLLAPWLLAGFTLNFPENINTRDIDRRELGPTLVAGTSQTYQRLEALIYARLPLPGTVRRAFLDWSLTAPAQTKPWYKLFAYWLTIRPLRDVIGFSRTRVPLLVGEVLPEPSAAFFAALGIRVRNWPDACDWQPSPNSPKPKHVLQDSYLDDSLTQLGAQA
ncbi:AMP-binding protein [Methylovulum psychrotolerans]|uniref:Long-chain fatty acid--CoA ligase n=1 Tax=Methylovulum psychrotolerans TaxID=1704499 RepID=A0A1Z4BZ77_9GAMM|nr:AMP-binding protein [Methylovulum psychrotolerans]ASF46604.1 long-chain fatty acid--CoA ligase [Methylovulum psychrotolerans]